MRFLIDAQLPPALARMLEDHGHVAEHVHDVGLGRAPDHMVWAHAIACEAVVVTKDDDFARLAALTPDAPRIVWIRVGNTSRRALLEWFEPLLEQLVATIDAGEGLIEVR